MKGEGKQQKNPKTKFKAPKPKFENQQHEESSDSKKNKGRGHHGKEKVKCSYNGKGFHPEHACMKTKLDEATIRGNLGSKMGLIRKHAKISFCELEFKNQ